MRIATLLFTRRQEIERLFSVTAAAFGCPTPPPGSRRATIRLREYALFTRKQADEVLRSPQLLQDVRQRLFRGAFELGASLKSRLRVRSHQEAMQAVRLIYRGLGIDFRARIDGTVVVRRCSFASTYTSDACSLISALDCGLIAGLTCYGGLCFTQRITDGTSECRAYLVGRTK